MTTQTQWEHPPTEESPDNQTDKTTQPIDGSQPLLSPIPVLAQLAQKWSSHCVGVGSSEWAQKHELPPTKADLATTAVQCLACQQRRPMLGSRYSAISQRPASHLVTNWLLRTSGRSIDFIWISTGSRYSLVFLPAGPWQHPVWGLRELSASREFCITSPLTKNPNSQQRRCGNGHGIMGSMILSHTTSLRSFWTNKVME